MTVIPEAPAAETLSAVRASEKKALRASFWTILEYGSGMALRVVSSFVLTRLLQPAFFGEAMLVTTAIVGITLLSDIGIAPSVIQSPSGDEPFFLNTAWTIQALRGVVLWLVAVLVSWPMATFYHDPKLTRLLIVLACSTLIGGFCSTNLLSLGRHMEVRRLFAIDGSTAVVGLIATISWAHFWPSVWALVGGQVIATIYRLILSHIPSITPGIRNSFQWDKQSVQSIVHFGKWVLLGTAFFFIASQSDRLILGKLISLSLLGIYGLAYQISDIPRAVILSLSQRVAYPFIAKIINLPMDQFRLRFLRYRFFALLAGGFLLSIMVTWGNLIILRLFDSRYQQAAWMIPILALGLWQTLLYQTIHPVLFSLGKTGYSAIGNAGYALSVIVGIPLAFVAYGMTGAVIAVAAADLPLYLANQVGATREGVRPLRQDLQMTVLFAGCLVICFGLKRLFS